MGLSNFELDGNKATIVSDRVQSILGFSATGWGVSKNIYVHDLSLSYATTPTTRNDNIFPLWFQYVDGVQVERVTVTNSWSAGVIFSACSNVKAYSNKISNTLADGMTCFGCGRNVTYFDNDFTNTSDDAMAVTWLAGNTAAAVGEVTIRTKGVRILYNRVNGTTVSARGCSSAALKSGLLQATSSTMSHRLASCCRIRRRWRPTRQTSTLSTMCASTLGRLHLASSARSAVSRFTRRTRVSSFKATT